ncbi:DUF3019 domain-containing protein [Vibrio rarus]|uniref:DUF3019 domain-containing protein n=1 Tax=Vibrio rarus TaxID=413403 RepID=UPI0021C32840|nr:DUF3019 domain-containing protein [Vibrio rarus]
MNKILCCLLLLMIDTTLVQAQETDAQELTNPLTTQQHRIAFTATPDQCVALHKGQNCYQSVEFQWYTPANGDYCILQSDNKQRVICWEGDFIQHYDYPFESNKTTKYMLINKQTAQLLAEVKVVVTWVYKAPKQSQSGWRLF